MRFLTLVKGPEGVSPPPELLEAIGRLGEEAAKAGVMIETGGLLPSAAGGTRVRISGGKTTVTDGPFSEAKELVGGYALFDVKTKDEVVEWTRRFMDVHRELWPDWEGETEIRQLFEAGDFPRT
jgi:hypothetical protein